MTHKQDMTKRSKQPWERGRGARRIGNPRYKPVIRNGKKVYVLRNPNARDRRR